MDSTPNYLEHAERVHELYQQVGEDAHGDLKLIIILREPISRELSLYHLKKKEYLDEPDVNKWYGDIAFGNGTLMSFEHYSETVLREQVVNPQWKVAGKYVVRNIVYDILLDFVLYLGPV